MLLLPAITFSSSSCKASVELLLDPTSGEFFFWAVIKGSGADMVSAEVESVASSMSNSIYIDVSFKIGRNILNYL